MAIDTVIRGQIEEAIDDWIGNPEINIGYIRSIHPNGNPDHNYIVGFIHGNIEQYCMCLNADYFGRKPRLNERIEALSLLKRRITEIDDVITRAEELETAEENEDELDDE